MKVDRAALFALIPGVAAAAATAAAGSQAARAAEIAVVVHLHPDGYSVAHAQAPGTLAQPTQAWQWLLRSEQGL